MPSRRLTVVGEENTVPRRRWMRGATLLAALAVVAAACGQEGDAGAGPGASASEAANLDAVERVDRAATALVDGWGDRGGFLFVFAALDRGYTITQVVAAVPAGSVRADGTIDGVEPDGAPLGLLGEPVAMGAAGGRRARMGPAGLAGAVLESPADRTIAFVDASLGELFEAAAGVLERARAREQAEVELAADVTSMTILLSARGYTAAQITEAILLGTAAQERVLGPPEGLRTMDPRAYLPCWHVVVDGAPLAPELPPALGISCPPVDAAPATPGTPEPTTGPTAAAPDDAAAPDAAGTDPTGQRYVGTVQLNEEMVASRAFELVEAEGEVVVEVVDAQVTGLSLRYLYAYRTCGQVDGTLACTIDTSVEATMTGGPVPLADGTATVPLDATVHVLGCSGSAEECSDFPLEESALEAAAELTVAGDTLTGVVISDGVPAFDVTASR